jgi:predicted acetyltransferase
MGETNSPSVAHVGYDISPLSRVKFISLEKVKVVVNTNNQTKQVKTLILTYSFWANFTE